MIQGCYETYVHERERESHTTRDERVREAQRLMTEVNNLNLETEDQTLHTRPFSEAYKKGSLNKK